MEYVARVKKLFEFDDIDFWFVSGDIVHKDLDQRQKNPSNDGEFMDVHNYVFKFMPEQEIWISDLGEDTDCIMMHEYVERLLMVKNHLSYEKAHRVAAATQVYIKTQVVM